jgi:hypothetical protein
MTINVGASSISFSDSTTQTTAFTSPLPISQGGLGAGSTPSAGQIPIGTGSGYSLNTLTAGIGTNITNGGGSITISTNQPFFAFGSSSGDL